MKHKTIKIKPYETIENICPVYNSLSYSEQLSILYYFLVLINNENYELTELVFNFILSEVFTLAYIITITNGEYNNHETQTKPKTTP